MSEVDNLANISILHSMPLIYFTVCLHDGIWYTEEQAGVHLDITKLGLASWMQWHPRCLHGILVCVFLWASRLGIPAQVFILHVLSRAQQLCFASSHVM